MNDAFISRTGAPTADKSDSSALDVAAGAIGAIRKAKSERRLSMRAPVARLAVTGPADQIRALESVLGDVRAAGLVANAELTTASGGTMTYEVSL